MSSFMGIYWRIMPHKRCFCFGVVRVFPNFVTENSQRTVKKSHLKLKFKNGSSVKAVGIGVTKKQGNHSDDIGHLRFKLR